MTPRYTIRERSRRGRPKEAFGEYMTWTEWQVVERRRIVGRFDFEDQAKRWIAQKEVTDE